MTLFLIGLGIWLAGGALSLLLGRQTRLLTAVATATMLAGAAPMIVAGASALHGTTASLELPWQVPLASFCIGLDPLTGLFLIPTAIVCGLAAVYGGSYLAGHDKRKVGQAFQPDSLECQTGKPDLRRNLGPAWFHFHLLAAAMALVLAARNAILFLAAWEAMTLASFFLVMHEGSDVQVRRAGWIYLVASHIGVVFVFALFAMLGQGSGSLDFARFLPPVAAGPLFLLALVGFGTKAGLMPLHVWLPEAHPAAPSHVSAVMSGVMIKLGIYGLLRTLTFLGPLPAWCGGVLIAVGAISAVLGVLFALAQTDLKRILAYSSVENMGIIALAVGLGLLGLTLGSTVVAVLAFSAALIHVCNHALFKSGLFLAAGAVVHATGQRNLERLGGLLRRMPWTGATFLLAAAAISGLPPLNGFLSEMLLYLAAFDGLHTGRANPLLSIACVGAIGSLALTAGLAAACFLRAAGIAFLGEPRSAEAAAAHESPRAMRAPMVLLALACVAVGLLGRPLFQAVLPAAQMLAPDAPAAVTLGQAAYTGTCLGALVVLGLVMVLALFRGRLLRGREKGRTGTWDCGYIAPTPRMQYTASSFGQAIVFWFRAILGTRAVVEPPDGPFPTRASMQTHTPDRFQERLFAPLFSAVEAIARRIRRLQQGRPQSYVLYIAIVLVVLLIWKLG